MEKSAAQGEITKGAESPLIAPKTGTVPVPPRLVNKFFASANGCWIWTGNLDKDGYSKCGRTSGHIRFYRHFKGTVPAGLTLDHKCRVRACVNPNHLEPVTQRVNVLRGEGLPSKRAQQTHCKRGHPFDEVNTRWNRKGRNTRQCRTCERLQRTAMQTGMQPLND